MTMSVLRQLVVLLPVAYLLSKINMTVMWFSFPIAEVVCLIIGIIFFILLRKKEFSKL